MFFAIGISISFSDFATMMVATAFPIIFVMALPSLINRSTPKINTIEAREYAPPEVRWQLK